MSKIKFVRRIQTATVGAVEPGDVHDVTADDADRYIRNGWAVAVKPAAKPKQASK